MKKSEFKKIIREEVIQVIQDVLPSLLAEAIIIQEEHKQKSKPTLLSDLNINENINSDSVINVGESNKIIYSSNPLINEVLNETRGGVPQDNPMMSPSVAHAMNYMSHGLPIMEEQSSGEYVPSIAREGVYSSFDDRIKDILPETNTSGGGQSVTPEELQQTAPEVMNALTKDYSELLKRIDSSPKKSGMSNIDFSKGV